MLLSLFITVNNAFYTFGAFFFFVVIWCTEWKTVTVWCLKHDWMLDLWHSYCLFWQPVYKERSQTFPSSTAYSQIPESLTWLLPALFWKAKMITGCHFFRSTLFSQMIMRLFSVSVLPAIFCRLDCTIWREGCSEKAVGRKKCGKIYFTIAWFFCFIFFFLKSNICVRV